MLAAVAPGRRGALLAARAAGHTQVHLDSTWVHTDRGKAAGPTTVDGKTVELWWSGKHHRHSGNVDVVTAPDGWPRGVFAVRPGREHDVTCARAPPGLRDALAEWTDAEHAVLADLGYQGEADRLTCPIKKPTKPNTTGATTATAHTLELTTEQRTINMVHAATRALAEPGNSLRKTTFQALRRVSLCPWRIRPITAAALVLLHTEHNRTT